MFAFIFGALKNIEDIFPPVSDVKNDPAKKN